MSKLYQGNFRYKRPSEGEYNLIAHFKPLGNYFIYFDGQMIDSDDIVGFHQKAFLFNDTFKLGSTVCREVQLKVLKRYIEGIPEEVLIKDYDNNVKFTLQVDNVDDTNIDFYEFTLVDKMVNLNFVYDFSEMQDPTAQTVLTAICENILDCDTPTIEWGGDITIAYDDTIQARDYVSYIAEINGCFARINETGDLNFVKFDNYNIYGVDVNTCKDFTLGEYHKIERVYCELGTGTYYYPEEYTGDHDTLYLNPDNVLITDSGDYTRESVVQHIYEVMNGYEFYSVKTSRCAIYQDQMAGDRLSFSLDGKEYYSIAQIDWDFNVEWYGGYECEVETKKQQETQITQTDEKIRNVSIKVDRVAGTIEQQISDTNDNVSTIIQNAQSLTGYFSSASGAKYIRLTSEGIQVSKDSESSSVNITDDGVYIRDSDQVVVASMKANEFDTTNWIYSETRNGNCLNIYKRRA